MNSTSDHTSSNTVAQLIDSSMGYDSHVVLSHINLSIRKGEFIALVGPNGSGKTTLMKSLLGLIPLIDGERELFGKRGLKLSQASQKISYVPQKLSLNRSVPISVIDFLKLKGSQYTKTQILESLESVELLGLENKSLHEISGGQLQRVLIAYAFMGDPELICLDEATEGIDIKSEQSFYDLLKILIQKNQATLIMISHDISAVTAHANRVICVNGKVLFDGDPKSETFHSCLHDIYGQESVIHGHNHSH